MNLTHKIKRENSLGVEIQSEQFVQFDRIVAFDWEENGSNGTVPILKNIAGIVETCSAMLICSG